MTYSATIAAQARARQVFIHATISEKPSARVVVKQQKRIQLLWPVNLPIPAAVKVISRKAIDGLDHVRETQRLWRKIEALADERFSLEQASSVDVMAALSLAIVKQAEKAARKEWIQHHEGAQ